MRIATFLCILVTRFVKVGGEHGMAVQAVHPFMSSTCVCLSDALTNDMITWAELICVGNLQDNAHLYWVDSAEQPQSLALTCSMRKSLLDPVPPAGPQAATAAAAAATACCDCVALGLKPRSVDVP